MAACCRFCTSKTAFSVTLNRSFRRLITTRKQHKIADLSSISFKNGETLWRVTSYSSSSAQIASNQLPSSSLVNEYFSQNVNDKDVLNHENVKDWWDSDGFMGGLHAMNDLRIPLIRNGLENSGRLKSQDINNNPEYLKGVKILEVGCGAGILCEPLARLGGEVTGIDPSQELIAVAKNHAAENPGLLKSAPTYINTNIEDHSSANPNIYDVVVASEVIEHVPNKQLFLDGCIKTLKPGGSIFLTTPNRTTASWLGSIVIAENVLNILPKGIHDWNKFIMPNELKYLLEKMGCKTILVNGMIYNVLTHKWSWTSQLLFHYALHAVKLNTTS